MANTEELEDELDPEAVRIGQFLRDLREANGWTLAQLGGAITKTHHYLSKVERGQKRARIPLCRDIAEAYGMPPDELVKAIFPNSPGVAFSLAHGSGSDPQEGA